MMHIAHIWFTNIVKGNNCSCSELQLHISAMIYLITTKFATVVHYYLNKVDYASPYTTLTIYIVTTAKLKRWLQFLFVVKATAL